MGDAVSAEDLILLRRLLARARTRYRALELAAGSVAIASGLAAAAIEVFGGAGSCTGLAAVLAGAGGVAFAAISSGVLARAIFAPPDEKDSAAWGEAVFPELREALVTAVEGGPFAPVCARRAFLALRGREAKLARVEPARRARARTALVGGALAALCIAIAARSVGHPAPVEPGAPAEDTKKIETPLPERPAVREAEPVSAPEVIAAARKQPRREFPRRADAAAILLSAPQGYEKAVELFVCESRSDAAVGPPAPAAPPSPAR